MFLNDSEYDSISVRIADESDVWYTVPTLTGYLVYGLLLPIITGCGAIFNLINVYIYSRPTMISSTYSYLMALSMADCISCILVFFSGLAKSVFWHKPSWTIYDTMFHLPIGSISSGVSSLIIVSVSLDRVVYIKSCRPRGGPPYCTQNTARKMIGLSVIIAILINIPFFFIYTLDDELIVTTTEFFTSIYFQIHNWVRFCVTGLFPAIFLAIANGFMISVIRKWSKCKLLLIDSTSFEKKRLRDQVRLTITLVSVVFLFIIGELPSYFASRQSSISLIFNGHIENTNSKELETFRIVATLLYAFHISMNIMIYAVLNPPYLNELFLFLQNISNKMQCGLCDGKKIRTVNVGNNINRISKNPKLIRNESSSVGGGGNGNGNSNCVVNLSVSSNLNLQCSNNLNQQNKY